MSDTIKWEDPPPKTWQTRADKRKAFVDRLKTKPYKWAYYGDGYNSGAVSNNSKAEPGTEWTGRKQDDGTYKVWGRWVGDA